MSTVIRRLIVAVALIAATVAVVVVRAPPINTTTNPPINTTTENEEPVTIQEVAGQEQLHRITLSERAADRLGIQTVEVTRMAGVAGRTRVPYSSIIYAGQGEAWIYIVDGAPLVFVRHAITVDDIVADAAGDYAILTAGPEPGTSVVSVGVAELYGAEFEVGN